MTLNPILHSLDQTTEFVVVSNTVIDAEITLATPTAPVLTARVSDLDLNWDFAANALFGDLGDQDHKLWQGNFTGSGKTEILFYYRGDGNWWLGAVTGTTLTWQRVGNTAGFGDLLDGDHPIWIGDFAHLNRNQVLFYYRGDGNWWLGTIAGGALTWAKVGNTAGFGNLLDGDHPIWVGDFAGLGKEQVLFYYRGDGNWWLGTIAGGVLTWARVATAHFGDLLDGQHPLWLGDFTGSGHTEVVFYYGGDGNWWLGTIAGSTMTWNRVANTGFGNLLDGAHQTWQGDFGGLGHQQLLFYYNGDGNWWFGKITGTTMTWTRAANTSGFGNLLDGSHNFHQGEFCGNGRSSLVFYYNGDGNWWHGRISGTSMSWSLPGNTRGFGNLLDGQHRIWSGRYSGSSKSEILFHYRGDGNFFLGQFDGARLRLPHSLEPGEVLEATQTIGSARPASSNRVIVSHNFATQHYDRPRTGWNSREATLTAANVHTLRKLYTMPTDDQVYTQPLYVQHVRIGGQLRNVVYVGTESDTVYCFDA